MKITVVGGGLAGSEAAYYLARRGHEVELVDIKPNNFTPAHKNADFGELVCSNSLKSNDYLGNACGLLKQEMRCLGSLVIEAADNNSVPAGNALAVERGGFARYITDKIKSEKNITISCREVDKIDTDNFTVIASGPLTTDALKREITRLTRDNLYFFDAASPIVSADSIDMDYAFIADRYGEKGKGDYLNCPIDEEGYKNFYRELISAECATLHDFEDSKVFDGCMPVEVMARRGEDTLRYGPLKPVGFRKCCDFTDMYAVLQLRKEDRDGNMYNLVGFQTNLLFGEQKRVFSMFPALRHAEFLRYGVMHKNFYINAPISLTSDYSMREYPLVSFAGQISGVEGYVESSASGLLAAISIDRKIRGLAPIEWDNKTVMGALASYVSTENSDFQPMNANYGILTPVGNIRDKKRKKELFALRSLETINAIKESIE